METLTTYEARDGIVTIALSHSEKRNALSLELLASLHERLSAAAADDSCRVVVLTNVGTVFSAGADLRAGTAGGSGGRAVDPGDLPASAGAAQLGLADVLSAIMEHPRPVVGRIAGHCFGGGVGLAAACDISVAASDVRFGFREVRVGVAPAVISVVCLAKMRRGDALELFLSGEPFSAARAATVGLVTSAVSRSSLDATVASVARKLLAGAPSALTAAKRIVNEVPHLGREAALEAMSELSAELFASDAAMEGMAAFAERRRPSWDPAAGRGLEEKG